MFRNVKNLAVPVLLVTSLIDKFVKGIFLSEMKIVRCNSEPVQIMLVQEALDDIPTTTRTPDVPYDTVLAVETEEKEHVVHVARVTPLQPMSEMPS